MSELKKDFKNRIEFYSGENSNAEDIVGGHTSKTFVRLNDDSDNFLLRKEKLKRFKNRNFISRYLQRKVPKDSQFFKPLFYELMNRNSHYITYLNELFEDKRIDIPTHISCLIKKAYTMEEGGVYGECYGSRLANAFEVDTVYNVPSNGYLLLLPNAVGAGNLLINGINIAVKNRNNNYDNAAQLITIPVYDGDSVSTTVSLVQAYFLPRKEISLTDF